MKYTDIKNEKHLLVKRKPAGKTLGYTVWALFMCVVILGVMGCLNAFNKRPILLGVALFISVMMQVINGKFCWVREQRLYEVGNNLIYEYKNPVDILGNDTVLVTLEEVTGIRKGIRHLHIYGNLKIKEPMRKTKEVYKVQVYDYVDDTYEYLMSYFNLWCKNGGSR